MVGTLRQAGLGHLAPNFSGVPYEVFRTLLIQARTRQ